MRIGPDDRIRVGEGRRTRLGCAEDHAREVLDVDLVDDPRIRRDGFEAVERLLPPFQERVALPVTLEFEIGVHGERLGRAERIDLHRVIDHELDRLQRVDLLRFAAHRDDRIAHRGEIDDARHTGEILQQNARRAVRDLARRRARRIPACERRDILARDAAAVLRTQQVLEQDLQAERQRRDRGELRREGLEPEIGVGARPYGEFGAGGKAVRMRIGHAPGVRPGRGALL